jgi:hypothetical protein
MRPDVSLDFPVGTHRQIVHHQWFPLQMRTCLFCWTLLQAPHCCCSVARVFVSRVFVSGADNHRRIVLHHQWMPLEIRNPLGC